MAADQGSIGPHVVLLSMPAPGHMIPFIALGKFLVRRGIKVTLLSSGTLSDKLRHDFVGDNAELNITFRSVVDDPLPEPEHITKLVPWLQKLSNEQMVEEAEGIIRSLAHPPCCFISDVFIGWGAMLERKLRLPRHFLITMSAASLAFMFSVPQFAKQGLLPIERSSDSSELVVPGVGTIPPTDVWEYFHKGGMFQMDVMILALKLFTESFATATYLVNSVEELEKHTFQALNEPIAYTGKAAKILSIGPLESFFANKNVDEITNPPEHELKHEERNIKNSEVEKWLDTQPPGSILYIAFGTIFSLQAPQIRELAHALEDSEQPFVWVLRPPGSPPVMVSKHSFQDELTALLPPGFEERTRGRGVIVSSWAPQPKILGHRAVGLFMSHCGWNSILEAIETVTPMLGCPCFVDQWMNARIVVERAQIGLLATNAEGEFERGHLRTLIRSMMEGEEGRNTRANIANMNRVLRHATTPSTGSSAKNLHQYVQEIFALDNQLNH